MSAIEKIIDRLASEEYPDERLMLERGKLVEEARAELAKIRSEVDALEAVKRGMTAAILAMQDRAVELESEVSHWKANHDEMVERNELLRTRPDLDAEKLDQRLAIIAENERLRAKVAAGEELAEAAKPIAREGGVPQDGDPCHVGITTKEKCGRCSRQQALIDALADYTEAKP